MDGARLGLTVLPRSRRQQTAMLSPVEEVAGHANPRSQAVQERVRTRPVKVRHRGIYAPRCAAVTPRQGYSIVFGSGGGKMNVVGCLV